MITRRSLIWSLLAAPAIVHAGNLMPVKVMTSGDVMIWQGVIIQNWDGAILHDPSDKLIAYTRQIMRDYARTNLFSIHQPVQPLIV